MSQYMSFLSDASSVSDSALSQPMDLENHLQVVCSRDYFTLLSSNNLTDFLIKVKDTDFPVHKAILSARNVYFKRMLESDLFESNSNEMTITDFDSETVFHFLEYLYTGRVNSANVSVNLYAIADKYLDLNLKKHCEVNLCKSLNKDNVQSYLESSDKYNIQTLKLVAINFLANQNVDDPQFDFVLESKEIAMAVFRQMSKFQKSKL